MHKPVSVTRMTFEQAKARYIHRYTMEHVPEWAKRPSPDGKFYAPQYRTDREWFENTLFPLHNPYHSRDCHSTGQTWPLGQWLLLPFSS
jgi:hypothetical protein